MDIIEAIQTRRSIRKYTGEQVSDEAMIDIIRAGCYAPSAHNSQPWQFVVCRDPDTLEKIAGVHPYAKMVPQAGACIVVCGDTARQEVVDFLTEDCSAAIENMLLAAWGMGLGTVWCGLHPIDKLKDAMREFFSLPESIIPIGLVVVGHADESRTVLDRYDPAKVHWGKWDQTQMHLGENGKDL